MQIFLRIQRKSAIDYYHQTAGLISPLGHPRLANLLEGIKRDVSKKANAADPLTYDKLQQVITVIHQQRDLPAIRDKALFLLGFAGGFRASEILSLTINDLQFKKSEGLLIKLQHAKTDQYGTGHDLAIPYHRDAPEYCPVIALQRWLDDAAITAGVIFKAFFKSGSRLK